MSQDELKAKILDEMKVGYSNSLEKNYELAKKFIRITSEGKIDVIVKDNINGVDKIALYLIGKRYAYRADLTKTEYVNNTELLNELGIKEGSLFYWLKELRDKNIIIEDKKNKREILHAIALNAIEMILKEVDNMLNNQQKTNKNK